MKQLGDRSAPFICSIPAIREAKIISGWLLSVRADGAPNGFIEWQAKQGRPRRRRVVNTR